MQSFSVSASPSIDIDLEAGLRTFLVSEHFTARNLVKEITRPPVHGDYATVFTEVWTGITVGPLVLKRSSRLDALIKLNDDSADVTYRSENGMDLEENRAYDLYFDIRYYSADITQLGYQITPLEGLTITPMLSSMKADDLLDGRIAGTASAGSNAISGDINLEYYYTEDKVFDRVMERTPRAQGYAIDLNLLVETDSWQTDVMFFNIYGFLDWQDAGYTRARSLATPKPSEDLFEYYKTAAISGVETYETFHQRMIPRVDGYLVNTAAAIHWGGRLLGSLDAPYFAPMVGRDVGKGQLYAIVEWSTKALGLNYRNKYVFGEVISNDLDLSTPGFLQLNLGISLPLW